MKKKKGITTKGERILFDDIVAAASKEKDLIRKAMTLLGKRRSRRKAIASRRNGRKNKK